MNDQKLLELAARAVGAVVNGMRGNEPRYAIETEVGPNEYEYTHWDPLENSQSGRADCLQMEIDLKLDVYYEYGEKEWRIGANVPKPNGDGRHTKFTYHPDRQRASTMAAAEIGRAMMG